MPKRLNAKTANGKMVRAKKGHAKTSGAPNQGVISLFQYRNAKLLSLADSPLRRPDFKSTALKFWITRE